MKFTCNQINLLEAINTVSKSISNRSAMPILSCMLLKVENGQLYLIGTDLEISIKSKIEANVIEDGAVAIDAKLFNEIIRRLPEGSIEIETDENNYAIIKFEKMEYKIAGKSSEEYPELPIVEKNKSVIMFQDELKNMIKSTIFSIATEETKPVLMGELLEIEGNEISLVAVDGFRISYKKGIINNNNTENISTIIPGRNLGELSKILSSDKEDKINIYFTDRHVLFEIENSIIITRVLEGKFINYKQNLVDNSETSVTFDRVSLLNALERVSLILGIDKKQPIKFEIVNNDLIITSNTTAGMGHEELYVDKKGNDITIAFNPKYLLDVLRILEEDEIEITFNTPLSPCIIKSDKNDKYKYLILPLRLNI